MNPTDFLPTPRTVVYILGPMTGYPNDNRPAFRRAAACLREAGYEVISPDELDATHPARQQTWAGYLQRDIPQLVTADGGVALPGWRLSAGASLEATILTQLGKPIWEYREIPGKGRTPARAELLAPIASELLPTINHPI